MFRLLTAGIGIVAVGLLALGCGTSGEDGDTVEALTKAEFVERAEGVCADAIKRRKAAAAIWQKEHPANLVQADLDDAYREVIAPSIAKQAAALEALPPPRNDEAKLERMVKHLSRAGKRIAKEGTSAARGADVAAYLQEATKYGLRACARLY
jgi:hypothetical protein